MVADIYNFFVFNLSISVFIHNSDIKHFIVVYIDKCHMDIIYSHHSNIHVLTINYICIYSKEVHLRLMW